MQCHIFRVIFAADWSANWTGTALVLLCIFCRVDLCRPSHVGSCRSFFVIELHLRLSSALFSTRMSDTFIYWVAWGIPIVHGIVFWVSLTIGLSDISQLKRDPSGVYCHIMGSKIPTLLTGTLVILFLSSMLIMEVFTIIHLVRQRAAIEALKVKGSDFPFHLFLRTVLYTVSGGFGIIMVDVVMNVSTSVTVVLLALSILPVF
ncbi:hypothetical protein MIND_00087600 [Mycena indigotica]|uniref:Uncharacterized protein n=1 Tax=Mycena indigotica TaxID=2126181 RepID=A0A8H6WEH6_9AGAR|nr:uncharacterized protein MIND_00087600 [Mycena indigotica]KAF7315719.1 hypothetical protein MIND_00087600 [Mycena indigotica]